MTTQNECILWPGAKNSGGYPVTWKNGRTIYEHRRLLDAKSGEIVLHSCDTPSCVNPKHLSIATPAINSADMVSKNRQAKGEQCGNTKLTSDLVLEIKSLFGKMTSRKVAEKFNVSKTNVLDIWNRKIWRHLEQ